MRGTNDGGLESARADDSDDLDHRGCVGEHLVGHEVQRDVPTGILAEVRSAHFHTHRVPPRSRPCVEQVLPRSLRTPWHGVIRSTRRCTQPANFWARFAAPRRNSPLYVSDGVRLRVWSSVWPPVLLEVRVVVARAAASRKSISGGMSCCEDIDEESGIAGPT